MKSIFSLLALFSSVLLFGQNTVVVPASESIEIAYPETQNVFFDLHNTSAYELEVAIVQKVSGEKLGGFGLAAKGKTEVDLPSLAGLRITNPHESPAKLRFSVGSRQPVAEAPAEERYINFTLRNETLKSIPLIIPGVMNPNLSPVSNSGVSLKIGQEIKFRSKGRAYILLTVDDNILEGQVLKVGEILTQRKAELGI